MILNAMTPVDPAINRFILQQTSATICCVGEQGKPWCFSCFYAYDPGEGLLYFKSSAHTAHAIMLRKDSRVAGTILPDRINKLLVKGIQLEGVVLAPEDPLLGRAWGTYHKKYPLALGISGELWAIQLSHIKMTDSTLGFGTKIRWSRKADQ
jgi:uncharacterized protein YhbP (UPF0306 family)